jgi:hypothetical protein
MTLRPTMGPLRSVLPTQTVREWLLERDFKCSSGHCDLQTIPCSPTIYESSELSKKYITMRLLLRKKQN